LKRPIRHGDLDFSINAEGGVEIAFAGGRLKRKRE
jgi:hypothetical protein